MEHFSVHPDVAEALGNGEPVVALESTVISHGLPHPENLESARAMEGAIRAAGALPATIAILEGRIHIGLSDEQLAHLARLPGSDVLKCSRRDLAIIVSEQRNGTTTVATTMWLAERAGIELFATGGIGGVHRGAPFDVSADLSELGQTPVTVVCSGAKSILDLASTLEVLETNGVPVIGYGTDVLPAFYARSSSLPLAHRLDTPETVANLVSTQRRLGLRSGILVTVPVPQSAALTPTEAESAIEAATAEAEAAGVHGAATTPWLLRRVAELTSGKSLRANAALLVNNARVAGEIAVALASRR